MSESFGALPHLISSHANFYCLTVDGCGNHKTNFASGPPERLEIANEILTVPGGRWILTPSIMNKLLDKQ